jgi:hypothetical protein
MKTTSAITAARNGYVTPARITAIASVTLCGLLECGGDIRGVLGDGSSPI